MAITYTINHRSIEGNRRVNYGGITMSSGEVAAYVDTGLGTIETFEVWSLQSGGTANATYPTSYPERNNLSGVVTVVFTSTAGPVVWRAKGKV